MYWKSKTSLHKLFKAWSHPVSHPYWKNNLPSLASLSSPKEEQSITEMKIWKWERGSNWNEGVHHHRRLSPRRLYSMSENLSFPLCSFVWESSKGSKKGNAWVAKSLHWKKITLGLPLPLTLGVPIRRLMHFWPCPLNRPLPIFPWITQNITKTYSKLQAPRFLLSRPLLFGSTSSIPRRNVTDIHGDGRGKVSSQQSRERCWIRAAKKKGKSKRWNGGDENSRGEERGKISWASTVMELASNGEVQFESHP